MPEQGKITEHGNVARAEYIKKYRDANKDKIAESRRKYYETHKEQMKESSRKYYEAHKEEIKARNAVYWDKKAAESIIETPELRFNIDEMQEIQERDEDTYETPEMPCKAVRTIIKRYELRKKICESQDSIQEAKNRISELQNK